MEIKIDDDWIITADSRQYLLSNWQMIEDKKGKKVMKLTNTTSHGTLVSTFKSYTEKKIRSSSCKSIEEVKVLVEEIKKIIEKHLGVL